jgi:hypothetical protein
MQTKWTTLGDDSGENIMFKTKRSDYGIVKCVSPNSDMKATHYECRGGCAPGTFTFDFKRTTSREFLANLNTALAIGRGKATERAIDAKQHFRLELIIFGN